MLVQVGETTEESNLGTNLGHARGVTNRPIKNTVM
jgi:hypothetical protein